MGMQAAQLIRGLIGSALYFVVQHPRSFAIVAILLAIFVWFVWTHRPEDLTGNGVTIGQAKAFDSSSLILRLQRLNSGLETLKVVNQNITENLSAVQERTSTESSESLVLGAKDKNEKNAGGSGDKKDVSSEKKTPESPDSKSRVGLGAADVLTNQVNLASLIFSLQALYEGSLSDRMINDKSRLQTVLGFQVSISPPAGYADSVAIVEMAVRTKPSSTVAPVSPPPQSRRTWIRSIFARQIEVATADGATLASSATTSSVSPVPPSGVSVVAGAAAVAPTTSASPAPSTPPAVPAASGATPVTPSATTNAVRPAPPLANHVPVSLVALMPQEKTYNAELTTSTDRSLDGAGTVRWFRFGVSGRKAARGAFMRRDPETVAFERKQGESPELLDGATVFGWEFRPELGRRAIAPGPRQLMAVIAVPADDDTEGAETILQLKTRSYWRRYNRRTQTSGPAWSWLPWSVDRSGTYTSDVQELAIPNTARIQSTLAPSVSEVNWTDAGGGKAYVTVSGRHFFPGTKVLIGGQTKSEKDESLTLKSEQTLEFEAPLASLAFGGALLIGRYGEAIRLEDGRKRQSRSLGIWS